MQKLTYKEAEKKFYKEYPKGLYLNGYIHNSSLSLQDFIKKFFDIEGSSLNRTFHTYSTVTKLSTCYKGARRSVGDMFLLCRTYYPECTLREVHEYMQSLPSLKLGISSNWCSAAQKRVYKNYSETVYNDQHYQVGNIDEHGWLLNEKIEDE